MRNYHINTDKLVNQLMPHYLGGRKLVLFVQSLLYPLQHDADIWKGWSHDTYQEAAMTTQVFLFESFLNNRMSKYFANPKEKIQILDTQLHGVTLYWKRVASKKTHLPIRKRSEHNNSTPAFYGKDEKQKYTNISFIVMCPEIKQDKVSEFESRLIHFVDRYRLAGKNYVIEYKQQNKK